MSDNTLYPNTYQHHNVYVDRISYYLTGNEEKVLNHILREIMGWEKGRQTRSADISISTLTDGKVKQNGEVFSLGCGLGASAVRNALKALVQFGLIERVGDPTQAGQRYALQMDYEKLRWDLMEQRKERRCESKAQQAATAREALPDPLLADSRGISGYEEGGISGYNPKNPPNPPNPKDGSDEPLPVEDEFDELFPPREPTQPRQPLGWSARDLQTQEGRDRALAHVLEQRRERVAGSPWLDLETVCPTIAKYSPPVEVDRDFVLRVVMALQETGIPLDYKNAGEVRYWLKESESLGRKTGWRFEVIERALAKALGANLSLKGPQSIGYAVADELRAKTQAGSQQLMAGGDGGVVTVLHRIELPEEDDL